MKILKQHWIDEQFKDEDLCSHGEIYLSVNGLIITQPRFNEEWGISESALALLRTLDKDYICDPDSEEGLVFHGCGAILMMGCPISIHWSVKHCGDEVLLSDFVKFTTTNPQVGNMEYKEIKVKLSKEEYRDEIISFALQAKELFDNSSEKIISDDFDKDMYREFWNEYNYLLESSLSN
ncbi:hypothetical protein COJ21_24875 [Priestia megaterium]|nr:hypothetical protein COJ21_24875 [Priestia megaterium]